MDDVSYSNTNWTMIDSGASFDTNCSGLGITEESNSNTVSVFPIPTSNNINISSGNQVKLVRIFDLHGKLMKTETNSSFSIAELSEGIYIISVLTDQGIHQQRIIKI